MSEAERQGQADRTEVARAGEAERTELVDAEVHKARRTRYTVTAIFLAMVVVVGLFARWVVQQRHADCHAAIEARDAGEQKDVELWGRAADYLDAEPEVRADFLAFIHDTYDAMPPPGPCGGDVPE